MALPWYVTGAARPQHAQYSGWQQADAIRARTAALQASRAPAPAPASRPAPQRQTWAPRPQPWQGHVEPSQRQAGMWGSNTSMGDRLGQAASAVGSAVSSWWNRGMKEPDPDKQIPQSWVPRYTTPSGNSRGQKTELPFNVGEGLVVTRNEDFTLEFPGAGAKDKDEEESDKTATEISRDTYTERAEARNALGFDREETITPLSMEEWNAMSPRQKAAVQFNTDLIAAVEADRAQRGYEPTVEEKQAYDQLLLERFGTTASSAPEGIEYAPNVAGLLENANYIPQMDLGSIDDFLKLDVTIGMDEVRRIDEAVAQGRQVGPAEYVPRTLSQEDLRLQRAQNLAAGQEALQAKLAEGDAILASMSGTANTAAAVSFGAEGVKEPAALSDEDAILKNLYLETFSLQEAPEDELVSMMSQDMQQQGLSPERQQAIYDTLLLDVQNAAGNNGWQFEAAGGAPQRSPQDVARMLGAPILGVGG